MTLTEAQRDTLARMPNLGWASHRATHTPWQRCTWGAIDNACGDPRCPVHGQPLTPNPNPPADP
jgi:hypothetical protein